MSQSSLIQKKKKTRNNKGKLKTSILLGYHTCVKCNSIMGEMKFPNLEQKLCIHCFLPTTLRVTGYLSTGEEYCLMHINLKKRECCYHGYKSFHEKPKANWGPEAFNWNGATESHDIHEAGINCKTCGRFFCGHCIRQVLPMIKEKQHTIALLWIFHDES